VDEHAIFAAVAAQRAILAEAYQRSRAARRSASRLAHGRQGSIAGRNLTGEPTPEPVADAEARVPSLSDEDLDKMEFWS
jgi:hypothetical protein